MPIYTFRAKMGQEKALMKMAEVKGGKEDSGVWAVLISDSLKGYVFVEGEDMISVEKTMGEIRQVSGRAISGQTTPIDEIGDLILPKSPIEGLEEGKIVKIIDGPFINLRAKITRMDSDTEITVELLDSNMKLPVKIHADYVKKISDD
ncbi:MAG: transcription elongation factor Spt5 [Candidatus Heimdallarchaeota archaeon]|nr:transcription elongation factor Spt5 [Candidatus Heimdallarchaeota archaeon]